MKNVIDSFTGEHRFLSNFFPSSVYYDGQGCKTVEHAYQAAKTINVDERLEIFNCETPGRAKRLGKKVTIRSDWEDVKISIMEDLLRQKFQIPSLKEELFWTGEDELIEGNDWGDIFWGVCKGVGENHLGKLLMKIREENVSSTLV